MPRTTRIAQYRLQRAHRFRHIRRNGIGHFVRGRLGVRNPTLRQPDPCRLVRVDPRTGEQHQPGLPLAHPRLEPRDVPGGIGQPELGGRGGEHSLVARQHNVAGQRQRDRRTETAPIDRADHRNG